MSSTQIKWNMSGWRAVRTSPGVMAELDRRASRIAAAAGPGFKANPAKETGGRGRGRASVATATRNAARKNAKEHTLLTAAQAGRGS